MREPVFNPIATSAVYIKEFERGIGSNAADHRLDTALDKMVADIIGPRIKVMNAHAATLHSHVALIASKRDG